MAVAAPVYRNRSQATTRRLTPTNITAVAPSVERLLPNGDLYMGSFSGNVPHGSGKYLWTDGCMYEGEWRRGKASGKGKYSWPSGATYVGKFKSGRMEGFGTFIGSDGDNYRGNWSADRKHGYGRKLYANGDFYNGFWKKNLQDGQGKYVWSNGNKYVGGWKNGVISGRGVLILVNGNCCDAQWENGVAKGHRVFSCLPTWDVIRDFALQDDRLVLDHISSDDEEDGGCETEEALTSHLIRTFASRLVLDHISSDDEEYERGCETEEAVVKEICLETLKEETGVRIGETEVSSESDSFHTANDDDFSCTTTETMPNICPNGRFKRNITGWKKDRFLGRGSFGSVYEGISGDGFVFALKEVSLLDQGSPARQCIFQLEQEIDLLSQFEHENIVQYYGSDKDESNLYIFLELAAKGSLLNLYQRYNLEDSQVSSYTGQILHGLKYLHDRDVVHRDIKCANILVDANESVKLADFGLAKVTKLNDVNSFKGTASWMAPEVVNQKNQGYGLPADIWSLGCTVLEMLTRKIPYSPLEWFQALYKIGQGELPPVPDSLSKDARDFILQCLQVNPNNRPTAAQLLGHSFVRRSLSTSLGSASPYHGRRN